jgi:hypothetical protein
MEKEGIIKAVQRHILVKLVEHRYWHHKHTNIHNLRKGLPQELKESGYVKEAIKRLLRTGWFLSKPTSYGLEISLNVRKKREIEEFIEKH